MATWPTTGPSSARSTPGTFWWPFKPSMTNGWRRGRNRTDGEERALRPPVVMCKITGGSRSEAGARSWAILASVMRTAQQQGRDLLDTIKALLRRRGVAR